MSFPLNRPLAFTKHPVAIFPWGANWLATDYDQGALLLIVNGKARVVAGNCLSSGPVHGLRDGNVKPRCSGN